MKWKYCDKTFLEDDDLVLNYFEHTKINHYELLGDEDKIMHDIRENMIKSKIDYDKFKKETGDSDLVFNSNNSDTIWYYFSLPGPVISSGFTLLSQSPRVPLISEIIPDMTNDRINAKNTVWSIILNEQLIFDGGLSSKYS